jgi:undecaprenyl diphosphate synthase
VNVLLGDLQLFDDGTSTAAVIDRPIARAGLAGVDMVLRTSGEQWFSNFMLGQSAYAEVVFMNVLWPDVTRRTLYEAIDIYARPDRRYRSA